MLLAASPFLPPPPRFFAQVITFAGELLTHAEGLLRDGLHTAEIADGYQKACDKVCRGDGWEYAVDSSPTAAAMLLCHAELATAHSCFCFWGSGRKWQQVLLKLCGLMIGSIIAWRAHGGG